MTLDIDLVRSQFPSLAVKDGGRRRIYFDNPAGTQVSKFVTDRISDYFLHHNANKDGAFVTTRATSAIIDAVRQGMAAFFNAGTIEEVVIGPSMTALTFRMARGLENRFAPGDEIIVTSMDHDGNVSPWLQMAERRGLVVKRLEFDRETYRYDMAAFERLLTPHTKFAAVNYASNITGTINDVGAIAKRMKANGGLTYVDAVQYAPHGVIDVQTLGCDFLVCSAYKFYGPHLGILWGRKELLADMPIDKLRAAPTYLPGRFEQGSAPFELLAGLLGALHYYAWIGGDKTVFGPFDVPLRTSINAGKLLMLRQEERLAQRLIEGLRALPGIRVHGLVGDNEMSERVSTVSISVAGRDPDQLAEALAERNIFVWSGHNYALDVISHLGLGDAGVLRIGPVHYNTDGEVDEILSAMKELVA